MDGYDFSINIGMSKAAAIRILIGLGLLGLFHFETLTLFGIKLSHLWKGLVLLLVSVMLLVPGKISFRFYWSYILIGVLQLVHVSFDSWFNPFFKFLLTIFFPLIGILLLSMNRFYLRKLILFFSVFFVLSFLPYSMGLLHSLEDGYALEDFGGSIEGLIGPYQTAHTASMTLASSILVLLYFYLEGSIKKEYTIIIFLGTYFLFQTYVRTGMVMLGIGMLPMLKPYLKLSTKFFYRLLPLLGLLISLIFYKLTTDPAMVNRIIGKRQYNTENSLESMGSGRGRIWIVSGIVFYEASLSEKIFGMGEDQQKIRIGSYIGKNLVSHNGFLDLLLVNGIVGLFLFLIYLMQLFSFIRSYPSKYNTICIALLVAYLLMTIFQGYNWINNALLLMIAVSLNYHESISVIVDDK